MKRRAYIVGIIVAAVSLFAGAALCWPPVNPGVLGGSAPSSVAGSFVWSAWTWQSESTLKTDQDGDGTADTDTCLMESLSVGGSETSNLGYAYVCGSGNIAAAVGVPPYRTSDGSFGNRMNAAKGVAALVTNSDKRWSIFLKVNLSDFTNKTLVHFLSDDNSNRIQLYGDGSGYLSLSLYEDWTVETNTVGVVLPVNTDVIIGVWADGINRVRFGFTTTVSSTPIKWSNFTASRRAQLASLRGDFAGANFAGWRVFYALYDATHGVIGKLYGSVTSSKCFIDNSM